MKKRILAFGTFDNFHGGHAFFLEQAKKNGDYLIVGIARDEHVFQLKARDSKQKEQERLDYVSNLSIVDEGLLSDKDLGAYQIIDVAKPDIIVLGHDQHELHEDLKRWMSETGNIIPIKIVKKGEKLVKEMDVAIAFIERNSRLLLVQRKDKRVMWDKKWEFPGGKIEAGESPEDAVVREIKEETGLDLNSVKFLGLYDHDWNLGDYILRVHLHCFHASSEQGGVVIENRAAYTYAWEYPSQIHEYDNLDQNVELIRKFF